MRSLPLLLLLVLTSSASAESIKLGTKPPATGAKWTEEKSMTASITIETHGKTIPMTMNRVERKRIEVLAVKGDVVVKAKITYDKASDSQKLGANEKGGTNPAEGKTYTVTAGEPIAVEPGAEAEAVRKLEKRFGKPDRMRNVIAGHEYVQGKVIELKPSEVTDFLDDQGDVEKFTLEYAGMEGKSANFKMHFEGTKKDKAPIKIEMSGKVLVDPATAQPLSMDLTGTMKSIGGDPKIDGTITMTGHRTK